MSHYAKVLDGRVQQVIVAEKEFFDTFVDTSPGEWVQTSYNTRGGKHTKGGKPLRKNFAGIGFHYDGVGFYPPQNYPSWTLNKTTYLWEPPVAYPDDADKQPYDWDEENKKWVKIDVHS